jgi:hypothetical protein
MFRAVASATVVTVKPCLCGALVRVWQCSGRAWSRAKARRDGRTPWVVRVHVAVRCGALRGQQRQTVVVPPPCVGGDPSAWQQASKAELNPWHDVVMAFACQNACEVRARVYSAVS